MKNKHRTLERTVKITSEVMRGISRLGLAALKELEKVEVKTIKSVKSDEEVAA